MKYFSASDLLVFANQVVHVMNALGIRANEADLKAQLITPPPRDKDKPSKVLKHIYNAGVHGSDG